MKQLLLVIGIISLFCVASYEAADVTTICGSETNETLAQKIQTAQWLASDWLLAQRTPSWGWDFLTTASAILSLQLANETFNAPHSLEDQLSIKQLELEMLHEISHRHSYKNLSLGYLAYYAMGLNATCHTVHDFRGHNLLRQLHIRLDNFQPNTTHNYFPYSLAVLALCNSGSEVPAKAVRTLQAVQGDDGCFPFGIDVTSMAVMAMSCIHPDVNSVPLRNKIHDVIHEGTQCIRAHQNDDGGFSNQGPTNIISTALAAQALMAAKIPATAWNCEDTLGVVLGGQHGDGHFGSHSGTIQILPLLSNRHHGSLREMEQECVREEPSLGVVTSIGSDEETIMVNLEINQNVDGNIVLFDPIQAVALPGENLFRVMERARQDFSGIFSFKSRMTQWGNHIYSINNVENDNANGIYWFISERDENGNYVSATTGTDGIFPQHNSTYLWEYRPYTAL